MAIERDPDALAWLPAARAIAVTGDAADEAVAEHAADRAQAAAPLAGWVNNAAVFRDASLHDAGAAAVLALVLANLGPALAGCAVAVRRFLATGAAARSSTSRRTRRARRSRAARRTSPPRRPSRASRARSRSSTAATGSA